MILVQHHHALPVHTSLSKIWLWHRTEIPPVPVEPDLSNSAEVHVLELVPNPYHMPTTGQKNQIVCTALDNTCEASLNSCNLNAALQRSIWKRGLLGATLAAVVYRMSASLSLSCGNESPASSALANPCVCSGLSGSSDKAVLNAATACSCLRQIAVNE